MNIFIQIIIGLFIGDFVTAFFHWLEDTYFSFCTENPFISQIAKDNELHHLYPRDIVSYSNLQNMTVCLPVSIAIGLIIVFVLGKQRSLDYKYLLITLFIIGSIVNILHKYSHTRECETPFLLQMLQQSHLLVGHEHHSKHHQESPDAKYAIVFPITNIVLDNLCIWKILEKVIEIVIRIKPTRKLRHLEYIDRLTQEGSESAIEELHAKSLATCPEKLNMGDIGELKNELEKYYACA